MQITDVNQCGYSSLCQLRLGLLSVPSLLETYLKPNCILWFDSNLYGGLRSAERSKTLWLDSQAFDYLKYLSIGLRGALDQCQGFGWQLTLWVL